MLEVIRTNKSSLCFKVIFIPVCCADERLHFSVVEQKICRLREGGDELNDIFTVS